VGFTVGKDTGLNEGCVEGLHVGRNIGCRDGIDEGCIEGYLNG
jgi:hypothetical protein